VCIDASVALKLVVDESASAAARVLWRTWAVEGCQPIAPPLFVFETVSALWRMVVRGDLDEGSARAARDRLLAMPIRLPAPTGLLQRAWDLARRYERPQVYDSFYLALAAMLDVDLWTADRRFFNALRGEEPRVRMLEA
jgi:predicted nucleic acid-binding protein